MNTAEFLKELEKQPTANLLFEYKEGNFVRADFHLTEIKNVDFDTVDCGGVQNKWQETHVQIWENPIPEPQHSVRAKKAIEIFELVDKIRPINNAVDLKFEYGNKNFHTAVLPVREIQHKENLIVVKLGEENTTCKAKDRARTPEEKELACCAPVSVSEEKSTCSPNSGCC
ncbi:DUF6428 family protein [Mesonia maritima]|uniref:Uncharacterized protein n=1 Tax=Mesonia maritima TaxID=1793873 RepID=A0ABU1K8U4_9FLAO|nr:DUF6428 family protein [Mesonia maritima]MDR6302026.1 hypothetical protein [Mesonia maritima]